MSTFANRTHKGSTPGGTKNTDPKNPNRYGKTPVKGKGPGGKRKKK